MLKYADTQETMTVARDRDAELIARSSGRTMELDTPFVPGVCTLNNCFHPILNHFKDGCSYQGCNCGFGFGSKITHTENTAIQARGE